MTHTSTVNNLFKNVIYKSQSLFIPFIMCGHPSIETSIEAIITLIESGADMIELGVPFPIQ